LEIDMRHASRLGVAAVAQGEDVFLDGPDDGLEMTVERLELPPGVDVASSNDALAAYDAPEPSAFARSLSLVVLVLAMRRR
jgi:hypothetical protein